MSFRPGAAQHLHTESVTVLMVQIFLASTLWLQDAGDSSLRHRQPHDYCALLSHAGDPSMELFSQT